jgi:hypothetical protein
MCKLVEDKWKAGESKNGDAIIAIDEDGYGHMIVMLTTDENKLSLHYEHDMLPELEYPDTLPGLYYANMKIRVVYDDIGVGWDIIKPLYPIITNSFTT